MDLTEIYFEVVYPVFPFFHQPTLLRNVARGEYASSRSLFAAVMALCALSSARVRDGALYTERWIRTGSKPLLRVFRPDCS